MDTTITNSTITNSTITNSTDIDPVEDTSDRSTPAGSGLAQVKEILHDERFDRTARLLRLQGWRGTELTCAIGAKHAHRFAPGFCAIGAATVAITASAWVAAALALTAVIGVFARNHPVETIYNAAASRSGRSTIPRNKAAKRLGCATGTAFLGGSTVALSLGAEMTGRGLAGGFAVVAAFVAATNVCLPSVIFTALWGTERAMADRLI